ncbi:MULTISPECIES: ribose 5-phosphate isomerase A [Candidatus Nitrosocaldus]|jgi:ribose 5-phosphate isomerase A|uniref:Ribose-5-phosphate isomerase A n=1 Tax=Candidatus Nitrosocaldus cavascurensis TaxID=2058097 RepID=A0A2K5AS54_9ARCH|nr:MULTISPECIES: ribose 5-phosphate isomerase A [Candidatus Nitrosocaldus]SPC34480.1 ribose-5-phosphate isomerase [Candidatus Nitrosocaldus cavascurensis]
MNTITMTRMLESAVYEHVRNGMIIGLGSGRTVAALLDVLARMSRSMSIDMASIRFIPTSLQIKMKAEELKMSIGDESLIPSVDLVFDGADQIDANLVMIKGGGGALLREKVLMYAAKKVVILADESKYVDKLTLPIPIEVVPYARVYVSSMLRSISAEPSVRVNDRGYPVMTENGNIIIDTAFSSIEDPYSLEHRLKCIPGVVEVGLFSKVADLYYKAREDGGFDVIGR